MNEEEVIRKIKDGDINLFHILIKKYSSKMLFYVKQRVSKPEDAEDIIQNSFIKAYKAIDRFDEKKPFYPYFFSIVKRETAEFYRHNPTATALSEYIASYDEDRLQTTIDLKKLKEDHKQVLQWYSEGFSYVEISKKMNKSLNTVKTLIRRAKIQLLKQYEKKP